MEVASMLPLIMHCHVAQLLQQSPAQRLTHARRVMQYPGVRLRYIKENVEGYDLQCTYTMHEAILKNENHYKQNKKARKLQDQLLLG